MLELIETQPVIDVQESEFRRLLGYPRNYEPDHRSRELSDATRVWYAEHGEPWFYLREVSLTLTESRFALDGAEFELSKMHEQLTATGAHNAFVAVVSAGEQCETHARQLWEEEKPDEYFFLETFGSAVVEHLTALAANRMCAWADENKMVALPHYSPGYSGWDIADQNRLHDAIVGRQQTAFPGPLTVLESGMLKPKKSQIAVFGITRHIERVAGGPRLVPCVSCSLESCDYRRVPYKHRGPRTSDATAISNDNLSALTAGAKYSVNARALQKWSKERLRIHVRDDNTIEALFRYEGTTCSNMGRPLSYDYYVKLGSATNGYPILHAHCEPSPGDDGHTSMCAYLNSPDSFLDTVSAEQPMVGKRLDQILTWERPIRPSGCYCDKESRTHKWGIVFEVLHFTLAQSFNQRAVNLTPHPEFQPVTNLL